MQSSVARRQLGIARLSEPRRLPAILWAALILWTTALTLSRWDAFQVGVYQDDASYLVLARSLAWTDHYGLINAPGEQPAPAPFPCGFPLVLAPFTRFASVPQAVKLPSLIATLAVASLLFWGWPTVSRRSQWWGLAVSGLYLLAPITVDHARMVMSEAVFTLFLLAAIWLVERIARGEQPVWVALFAGALLAMVPITRTVGLLLLPVTVIYLAARCGRRVWRELGRLLAGGALCVGLILALTPVTVDGLFPTRYLTEPDAALFTALQPKLTAPDPASSMLAEHPEQEEAGNTPQAESTPRADNRQLLAVYAQRAFRHIHSDLRHLVLPTGGGSQEQAIADRLGLPALPLAIGLLAFALVVLGYARWLGSDGLKLLSLFTPLYLVALLFWNWDSPRLLYPIQPFLEFSLLLGIEAALFGLFTRNRTTGLQPYRQGGMAALVIALALISTYSSLRIGDSQDHVGDLRARTAWLRAYTDSSAVLMTEAPQVDYLYSERKTVPFPIWPMTAAELAETLQQTDTEYILLAPQIQWGAIDNPTYSPEALALLPALQKLGAQGELTLVYASGGLYIYGIDQVVALYPGS